jgi:ABC-type cobalamin/Fe3+-siderophores transport system ATPase subunit
VSAAVEVNQLVREFKGGIRAVDGLDLEVRDGEIYGFLGPNGAGKTTVVRILTTLLRPTSGSARVAGYDVVADGDAVRRSIGVALQEAAIDPLMTGRELLRMQGALPGLRRTCCSSTSRPRASIPPAAPRCGARSGRCTRTARRSSSRHSTSRRPSSSPTAWGSSIAGTSWPRAPRCL